MIRACFTAIALMTLAALPIRSGLGAEVIYLANEGVLIRDGETSIAFDPLFRYRSDFYQSVPLDLERAMLLGTTPFEDLDAVFISHHHGDHFSATLILRLLERRSTLKLYAPAQAVMELARLDPPEAIMARVINVERMQEGELFRDTAPGLAVAAVPIPHAGWPERRLDVQNLAFRVTLEDRTTVLHLGDADPRTLHFSPYAELWQERENTLVLPPYWFFLSAEGLAVTTDWIPAAKTIGIHLPASPTERSPALLNFELFTQPGEKRYLDVR